MKKILSFVLIVAIVLSFVVSVTAQSAEYSLDDKYVRILGRGELKESGRTFNWPNAGFEFEFTGTKAEVFVDKELYNASRWDAKYNGSYFSMAVYDGEELVRRERIKLSEGWNTIYTYKTGDPDAKKIMFVRSSEACKGTVCMSKLKADSVPAATKAREKVIEFIGDSYTAGFGNSPELSEVQSYNAQNTDNWNSFTGFAARHYNADNTVIAYGGKGLCANRNMNDLDNTMSHQFNYSEIYTDTDEPINMSTKAIHDFRNYQPHLVTVWLGTNDIAAPVPIDTFKSAYINLLDNIRAKYPDAVIICMAIPKNNMYYNVINQIVNDKSRGAENKYYFHAVNKFATSGIDSHPNVEEQKAIADELIKTIDSIPGVWEEPQDDDTDIISLRVDYNTGKVKVFGNTGSADKLISALVLKSETELATSGEGDAKYIWQTTSNKVGDYKFEFKVERISGDYTFYMNTGTTENLQQKTFAFKNLVPVMLVEKNGEKVTEMNQLAQGDTLKITLSGFEADSIFKGVLIAGYYNGERLVDVDVFDASSDSQRYGTEIVKETQVASGADNIKILYFNQANFAPLIGEYIIK